jgi:hypothetical protein
MELSQSTLWIIAAVLCAVAAILWATSGEVTFALVFGATAAAFLGVAFHPSTRGQAGR